MSKTAILYCSCQSTWQDQKYGNGKRVFNSCQKAGEHRCTVCGKTQSAAKSK